MANQKRKFGFYRSPSNRKRTKQDDEESARFRIPRHLRNFINQVSRDKTERVFIIRCSLQSMGFVRKLAWGIRDTATSIVVRVKFHDTGRETSTHFCVHNSSDKSPSFGHQFCVDSDKQPNKVICTTRPNIMTCVIGIELYNLIRTSKGVTLADIHQKIEQVITSNPTTKCLICSKRNNVKTWNSATCSDQCKKKLEAWPLSAQLSQLIIDLKAFDFLLCCIYTAALTKNKFAPQGTFQSLLRDCPIDSGRIPSLIDSFPKDLTRLMSSLDTDTLYQTSYRRERIKFLSWISSSFCGCLVSLPPTANLHINGMGSAHQFLLLNAHLDRQTRFMHKINALRTPSGSVAFHGTPSFNTLKILTEGLKANRIGLFYAPEPSISLGYAAKFRQDGHLRPWKKSSFEGSQYLVVFGCEVANSAIPWKPRNGRLFEHFTFDVNTVMVRYVFLCPPSQQVPLASTIQPKMLAAYTALGKGTLTSENIQGSTNKKG